MCFLRHWSKSQLRTSSGGRVVSITQIADPRQMQFNSEQGPLQPVTAIFRLHDTHRGRERERARGRLTAWLVLWVTWTRLNGMPETGTK